MHVLGRNQFITYENNDSCRPRLVIVLNFILNVILGLKFSFFSLPLSPPLIINHPETVNCCHFLFVSAFVGDFGRELSCKRAARL